MIDARRELELLVRSRLPFLVLQGAEEERIEGLLEEVARDLQMPLRVWSLTRGMRVAGRLYGSAERASLAQALDIALRTPQEALYLFKDLQRWLDDAETQRRLLDVARHFAQDRRTIVMAGPDIEVPALLRPHCGSWRLPLPAEDDLRRLTQRVLRDFGLGQHVRLALDAAHLDRLVGGLRGLTWSEAEAALRRCVADDLVLDDEDVQRVLELRRRALREGGILEYVPSDASLADVAGLENLKHWLALRRHAFGPEARAFGLPTPRGLLLLGVQGCGKSMAAKAVARDWDLPLLRMEVGRLYDKYIGESEKRLDEALRSAEALAPCVLMIDELEKALSGVGSAEADGGLSRRLVGRLLGWMQDRTEPVFVVATSNDITQLPPELVRKGRFDEIFFVDLPDDAERRAVFEVHLRRRGRDPAHFDLPSLAAGAEGFSGAEIEQAVVAGLYAAFAAGRDLESADLLAELRATLPLSRTRAESIAALRAWARGRAVAAGARAAGEPA